MDTKTKLWFLIHLLIILVVLGNISQACDPPDPGCEYDWECEGCESCNTGTGECYNDDGNCDYLCGCIEGDCDNCWRFSTVSSNEVSPCPECDQEEGGCYGYHIRIPEDYAIYVATILDPPDEEIGVCGIHYKTEPVRFYTGCIPIQSDAQVIYTFIYSIYSTYSELSTMYGCYGCVSTGDPSSCFSCWSGLITSEIWDALGGKCIWIEECERCAWDDDTCSSGLNTNVVVDWSATGICTGD